MSPQRFFILASQPVPVEAGEEVLIVGLAGQT